MTKIRVLIADDQGIVAAGIGKLLEPACEVVGIVENGRTLLVEAEKLRPDLIIMETTLPLLNGVDAARHLTKTIPESKIIFLTGQAIAVDGGAGA